ncbi:hypothetical protein RclHR1_03530003 [Rhizophagus clarus]|uniref:Uncharacterized protein n=1 Tax=Rhizophagus clarus TaxID=94130 RepID=A0A2Z6S5G4_9GLOM|nr:hypothetical protein RclHR1_03530003 [Rhizophagus clarus]
MQAPPILGKIKKAKHYPRHGSPACYTQIVTGSFSYINSDKQCILMTFTGQAIFILRNKLKILPASFVTNNEYTVRKVWERILENVILNDSGHLTNYTSEAIFHMANDDPTSNRTSISSSADASYTRDCTASNRSIWIN